MLTFRAFLTEMAASEVVQTLRHVGAVMPISAPNFGIQFVLPDGVAVLVDKDDVHARAVYEKTDKKLRLVDVLEAGIVRQASCSAYQVGARITSAQAQFMVDRCMMKQQDALNIGIAYLPNARSQDTMNNGCGPIEIDDQTQKTFDLDRGANASAVRTWVNSHF